MEKLFRVYLIQDMGSTKNFSIDKSDWKKVKLGDVVFEPKELLKT